MRSQEDHLYTNPLYRDGSQLDILLDQCAGITVFRSPEHQAFAMVASFYPERAVPIRSAEFRDFLSYRFNHGHFMPPSRWSVRQVQRELETGALFNGPEAPVAQRLGQSETANIYLDLLDRENRCVEIAKDGWTIQPSSSLASLLRLTPEQSTPLHTWLLSALRPQGPYPVLILDSPAASGKSTAVKIPKLRGPLTHKSSRASCTNPRKLWSKTASRWYSKGQATRAKSPSPESRLIPWGGRPRPHRTPGPGFHAPGHHYPP